MKTCRWCKTAIRDGYECDNCWEIRARVEKCPKVAVKILKGLGIIPKERSKFETAVDSLVALGWKRESAICCLTGE